MELKGVAAKDCRKPENMKELQSKLRKLKLLKDCSGKTVPLSKIELAVADMAKKYSVSPSYISIQFNSNHEPLYSVMVRNDETSEWVGTVYGATLYELYGKCCAFMYDCILDRVVGKRGKTKEQKERDERYIVNKEDDEWGE